MTEIDLSGARWHKSSHSQQNGNCLEVASPAAGRIALRDSKNPDGPKLMFSAADWTAFVSKVKTGRLGL